MMKSLPYLIRKEFIQFRRNKFLPRLIFLFPILIMLIAPLVANMEVKGVRVAFVDGDRSDLSRSMMSHIEASNNLSLQMVTHDYREAYHELEQGRVDIIVSIPRGYSNQALTQLGNSTIKIDANAVNSTKSGIGSQYVSAAIAASLAESVHSSNQTLSAEPSAHHKQSSILNYYNETLDYRHYMIPAFIIIIVLLVCCFIPALNLVLEKERGTIEQINVTPVGRLEFTLSKLIPYWLIGIVVITEGILTVGLVYGLWPAGSVGGIYLGALLFVLAMSGFAVAIANLSDTMQQCIFVLFFFVMLFMLMSGMLTPLRSMPEWAQTLAAAFPPRWFAEIMRALYLKGTTVPELSTPYLALTLLAALFCTLAALTYKKQS
jgi:ABC-2 type transport system permease protein